MLTSLAASIPRSVILSSDKDSLFYLGRSKTQLLLLRSKMQCQVFAAPLLSSTPYEDKIKKAESALEKVTKRVTAARLNVTVERAKVGVCVFGGARIQSNTDFFGFICCSEQMSTASSGKAAESPFLTRAIADQRKVERNKQHLLNQVSLSVLGLF